MMKNFRFKLLESLVPGTFLEAKKEDVVKEKVNAKTRTFGHVKIKYGEDGRAKLHCSDCDKFLRECEIADTSDMMHRCEECNTAYDAAVRTRLYSRPNIEDIFMSPTNNI